MAAASYPGVDKGEPTALLSYILNVAAAQCPGWDKCASTNPLLYLWRGRGILSRRG
jgi:hypothetical protein